MKILPVGAQLFHADGRSDIKLIVALRNFVNETKNPCNVPTEDRVSKLAHS